MKKNVKKRKSLFWRIGILLAFLLIIFFGVKFGIDLTGHAISTLQPNATFGQDTYIRQALDVNFGTSTSLMVGKTTSGSEFRSLLKFDTSSIPASDTVTNATLELYLNSLTGNSTQNVNIYLAPSNWFANYTTWFRKTNDSNWTSAGGDFSQKIGTIKLDNNPGFYNLTLTSTVENWLSGSTSNQGLFIIAANPLAGNYATFSSSDSTTYSERPKLVITHYGNVPPTLKNMSTSSSITNPVEIGIPVTFIANWTDHESDSSRLIVCNNSNITYDNSCLGNSFCTTSLAQRNPSECNYTTKTTDRTQVPYYSAVCDSNGCSNIFNGTFYTDHSPTIGLAYPKGNEIFNQTKGNATINFTVSDADNDTLRGDLYYGDTKNSTTNLIASGIDLKKYCIDPDHNTMTPNQCSYSWDTTGIYGDYYITVTANDSHYITLNSTNSSVKIRSLIDNTPPAIAGYSIEPTYSGKSTEITTTIIESHMKKAWVSFNYTLQNSTMINQSGIYITNFVAPKTGTYKYKIYAEDSVGNIGSTNWNTFTVSKPIAEVIKENSPSTSLPYHVIEVSSIIKVNDSIKNVSAYLNVPNGFTFAIGSNQSQNIGNLVSGETKEVNWYVSTPLTEATYNLNATFSDEYQNYWQSTNAPITITSTIGGYQLSSSGYTQVQTTTDYFTNAYFEDNGAYINPDSITLKIYDSSKNLVLGPVSMTKISNGIYNYSYAVGTSVLQGEWETIINATKGGTNYFAHEFWDVIGGPFDVRDIVINNNTNNALNISLTTINTGGTNQDLTLKWNLTRLDNNAQLDSGADTFMVPANSQKNWTIYPITNYVGQVKITLIGYYAGAQKAGAYKIFSTIETTSSASTPSTGGSSGSGSRSDIQTGSSQTNTTLNQKNIINTTQPKEPTQSKGGNNKLVKNKTTSQLNKIVNSKTSKKNKNFKQIILDNLLYIFLVILIILIVVLIYIVLTFSKKLRVLSIVKKMQDIPNKKANRKKSFDSKIKNLEKELGKD